MILEKETYEKFGYYPSELKPQSHKRILVLCDDCGKLRELYRFSYCPLCKSCAQKGEKNYMYGRTGENAPRFGQHHSEEAKQKISDALKGEQSPWSGKHRTEETRKKISKNHADFKGVKSPNWKGGLIKRVCDECGKEFPACPSKIEKGGGRFCSPQCFGKWSSKHRRGENSSGWKGGVSFEPYCIKFNNEFKEYIRDKFDRICFLCQKTEEENGKCLSVHHVNYNKGCGCDDDETCQFVPLCVGCNSKVNSNRDIWKAKIKAKMQNKLNGWYI